ITLIFGALRDKDARGMLGALAPRMRRVILTASSSPRAAAPDALRAAVPDGRAVEVAGSPREALALAAREPRTPILCIAGSLSLLGDVLHPARADKPCPIEQSADSMGLLFCRGPLREHRPHLCRRLIGAATGLLLALGAATAEAQAPQTPVTIGTSGGDVTVIADQLEQVGPDNLLIATGNVELIKGATRLMADRIELNRATGDAVAQGRVIFYDGEDQLTGQRIEYNVKTGTGVVYQAAAQSAPYYRIGGERMERLGEGVYRVKQGVFTTCDADPPDWAIRFRDGTADLNEFVYGTGASFWVRNLPLIPFIPIFAAAIRRERQTGFLFPKFGYSTR